jgi:hypothetical protein
MERLGGSLAAIAVLHLLFHNHVHVYERLPFAKQFACSDVQDWLLLYIRPYCSHTSAAGPL